MEPPKVEVMVFLARIHMIGQESGSEWIQIEGLPAKLWLKNHGFQPNDNVKVRITKEPDPNALPR